MKYTLDGVKKDLEHLGFFWEWQENDGEERFVVFDNEGDEIDCQLYYEYDRKEKEDIEYEILNAMLTWIESVIAQREVSQDDKLDGVVF
jgi:hypothetical protein